VLFIARPMCIKITKFEDGRVEAGSLIWIV